MAWLHPPAIGCRFSYLHLPCGRCGHTMCVFKDQLVLFGGYDGTKWLSDLHTLDTNSLVWSQQIPQNLPPQPRQYHTASVIESKMFVFGGYNGITWLSDTVALDLNELAWIHLETRGEKPSAREGHTMVAIGSSLYVFGGWDGAALGELHKLDTLTSEWSWIIVNGPRPYLCGHTMTLVKDKLFVFGGFDGRNWVNSLFVLDPFEAKPQWNEPEVSGEPVGRGYHSATLVNRYILIYAGYNGQYILADLVALDTETFTWSVPDPCSGHFPIARNAHTMTLCGSELYMFGGYNGTWDTNELHTLETAAFSSLHDDFYHAFEDSRWHDVELVTYSGSQKVHAIILKNRCPALYGHLLAKFPEFLEMKKEGVVPQLEIGMWSSASLSLFCEYLYCDLCRDEITPEVRDDLLFLSIKYDLPRLRILCSVSLLNYEQVLPESTLTVDAMKCREDEELCDLAIEVEDEIFYVHKVIMGVRCPYFQAMLVSGMRESFSEKVSFPNMKSDAFELVIEWIYSDKFSPLFSDSSIELDIGVNLLSAASMLDLQSLMRMTEIALERTLSVDNVLELFEVSHTIGAVKLRSYCVNMILQDFDRISLKGDCRVLSQSAQNWLAEFLPKRMRRQASNTVTFNELSMIKWEKEENKEESEQPVMISGNTLIPVKHPLTIRPRNPSSPANIPPETTITNAILPFKMNTVMHKPRITTLAITGISPHTSEVSSLIETEQPKRKKTYLAHKGRLLTLKSYEPRLDPDFVLLGSSARTSRNLSSNRSIAELNSNRGNKDTLSSAGLHICSSTNALSQNFIFESRKKKK